MQRLKSYVYERRVMFADEADGEANDEWYSEAKRLLSLRAAARLLGVDRGATLHRWISAGAIRTVSVEDRLRIPMSEVQRIEREGISLRPPAPRTRRKKKSSPEPRMSPSEIRAALDRF